LSYGRYEILTFATLELILSKHINHNFLKEFHVRQIFFQIFPDGGYQQGISFSSGVFNRQEYKAVPWHYMHRQGNFDFIKTQAIFPVHYPTRN
jgi:hypothetical protein